MRDAVQARPSEDIRVCVFVCVHLLNIMVFVVVLTHQFVVLD